MTDRALQEMDPSSSPPGSGPGFERVSVRVAALVLLVLASLVPSPAEAHQRLLRTEPARELEAREVPRELRLSFYEPVEIAFTAVELIGPAGARITLGDARLSPDSASVLLVPIHGPLQAGGYTVRWSTASRDGHPVRGEYGFSIAEDARGLAPEPGGEFGGAVTAPGQAAPPAHHHPASTAAGSDFQADSPAYVVIRWVTYLALIGVIGAVAFALLVLGSLGRRRLPDDRELISASRSRAAGVGLGLAVLLALAALARLYAQSLAMHGTENVLDVERIATLLRRTVWGWGWLIQVAATVLAAGGFAIARRGGSTGWVLAAAAVLALAVTPALSGHAAAMSGTTGTLAIVADSLHVLAAGGWLGSLLALLLAGIPTALALGPARRGGAVASLVRAFSPTALLFAGLLIATGVFSTLLHVDSVSALLSSRYGTILLIKLGIFLLVFATGAYNFLRVQPALGDDGATGRLRRSAGFELVVGTAVLLVTAVLVATAPPYEEEEIVTARSVETTRPSPTPE